MTADLKISPAMPVAEATQAPLGQTAARGLMYLAAQTIANKAVTLLSQILLAWIFLPDDLGVIGLSLSIFAFASILQQTGIREILVQRHAHFDRWQHATATLSLLLGVGGLLLMCAAAPLAGRAFQEPRVIPLIFVLAAGLPAVSLTAVPAAKLQIGLRFEAIALIGTATPIVSSIVAVGLALAKFGAISFAIGMTAGAFFRMVATFAVAGVGLPTKIQWRRCRYLLADSGWMTGAAFFTTVVLQGDYLVLGLTQSVAVVGIYYFAFGLSTQALQLITVNLASVLLPALARMEGEPSARIEKFLEASELLSYVGVPFCVLQATLARPLLQLIYGHRWDEAILPLQLLSIAMIPAVIGGNAGTLFQSQGRFRSNFYFTAFAAIVFMACVGIAARVGAASAIASAVILAYSTIAFVGLVAASRCVRSATFRIINLFMSPVLYGSAVWLLAWAACHFLLNLANPELYIATIFAILYTFVIRVFRPHIWLGVRERLPALRHRRVNGF